ncbi:MAG: 4-hydroxy-3-methylbut-2-enyl diphosphate reductase [Flavobacteriales bacterium]|nr:4-hydroxy-3-methylbut-2-enyl diphosphate reductase [Flavobacteriales bacterium]
MKKFKVPSYYNSNIIEQVRKVRETFDPRKKDLSPSIIELDNMSIYLGRHFGFCYGVKNAIEICYQALKKYPNKKIYLLSQMIHNQVVNQDLRENGISFIMDTNGTQLIDWKNITKNDIVIIPAFGTSLEVLEILKTKKICTEEFNTTCPFVSKVWNRLEQIAKRGYTIIIYGTANHEETRSTFSRAKKHGSAIIVEDINDAQLLCDFIKGEVNEKKIQKHFYSKYSENFNASQDLKKLGVVNQTTMLASDTQEIINLFTNTFQLIHKTDDTSEYVANTRDTLCYATHENQESTLNLLKHNTDLAIVVGGYNSSNTTHLVELASETTKTYFINSSEKIQLNNSICHFDIKTKREIITHNFIPNKNCKIILTSGASCPDIILENILLKLADLKKEVISEKDIISNFAKKYE